MATEFELFVLEHELNQEWQECFKGAIFHSPNGQRSCAFNETAKFARIIIWPNKTMHIWRLLYETKCAFELQLILNTPITEISNGLNTGN